MIRLSSILVLMILGAVIMTAQIPPVIKWQKTFGGSDREAITGVIPSTLDNSYFLIVNTFSKDHDFDFMKEGQRMCILKLDEKGNIVWKRPLWLEGAIELRGRGIVTSDNKLLLSCLVKQENSQADFDPWIIMMDMEGEIEWQRILGGSFDDGLGKAYETSDGDFIFTGRARSNDGTPAYNNGLSDGWIVKMDKKGKILSSRVYGGATSESFGTIAPTEGGYLVHGSINYTLTGRYVTIPGNKIDLMLTKIDENLDIVWQKVYGGSNEELWATIDRKENGNFIISSETFSTEVGIGNPLMGGGLWIYEVDEEGEIIWDLLTLEGLSRGDVIELKSQGEELLLLGNTSRNHEIIDSQYGERDVYLASLDQTGKIAWIVNYGGTDDDRAGEIICLDNNDYLLFGNTYSNDIDLDENKGESDIWLVYLETPSQIADEGQCQFKVAVNSNKLLLLFEESFLEPVEILVYDITGKLIYYDDFSQMRQLSMEIDLPNPLPTGQYFTSIRCSGGQTTIPFFYSKP